MIKRDKPSALAAILAIIFGGLFIVIVFAGAPLLALLAGMGIGYIFEIFTQDYVVQAFNVMGMHDIKDGDLPKVFGLLAVVAAMFKLGYKNAKDKDEKGNE